MYSCVIAQWTRCYCITLHACKVDRAGRKVYKHLSDDHQCSYIRWYKDRAGNKYMQQRALIIDNGSFKYRKVPVTYYVLEFSCPFYLSPCPWNVPMHTYRVSQVASSSTTSIWSLLVTIWAKYY